MIILIILSYTIIALIELPSLIRKRYWRDFAAFSFFFILSFILILLYSLNVNIPSPYKGIEYFIGDILHLSY